MSDGSMPSVWSYVRGVKGIPSLEQTGADNDMTGAIAEVTGSHDANPTQTNPRAIAGPAPQRLEPPATMKVSLAHGCKTK
jgi:hypothetical protein